jgi:membrane protease YdiL (CAAX protease family)
LSRTFGSLPGDGNDEELPPPEGTDAAEGSQADAKADSEGGPPTPRGSSGAPGEPATPGPIGSTVFSLEGRAAPGLYLVGWIGSVLGLAVFFALVLSGPGGTSALILALVASVLLSLGLVAAAGAQGMQRRARGDAYPGPSPFLVFAATLPVALPVAVIALRIAETAGVDPAGPLGGVIGQAVLVLGLVALVRLLVVGAGALSWREMAIRWPGASQAVGQLVSGAVLAIPVFLVTALLAGALVNLLHATPDSPLPGARDATGVALNFLAAVVIAPIGEEIFFRGFALTAWERALGPRSALIRSALFFAFVHVITVGGATFDDAAAKAFIGFSVRLPVAFALGWIFLQRRSIFAPIGLHAAFNGILLLIAAGAPTT